MIWVVFSLGFFLSFLHICDTDVSDHQRTFCKYCKYKRQFLNDDLIYWGKQSCAEKVIMNQLWLTTLPGVQFHKLHWCLITAKSAESRNHQKEPVWQYEVGLKISKSCHSLNKQLRSKIIDIYPSMRVTEALGLHEPQWEPLTTNGESLEQWLALPAVTKITPRVINNSFRRSQKNPEHNQTTASK